MEKEILVDRIVDVLSNTGYESSYSAIEHLVSKWSDSKKTLTDIFSKHENWDDDKLMIHFDSDYVRKIDNNLIEDFSRWLEYIIEAKFADVNVFRTTEYKIFSYLRITLKEPYILETSRMDINEECSLKNLKLNIMAGKKTTKVVAKIAKFFSWDKEEGWNKMFAKYSDSNSCKTMKRYTCISLNPIDFLLMSNGDNWWSCHGIGYSLADGSDNGEYASGAISYMLDSTSLITYTVSVEDNYNRVELRKKIQRQVFAYDTYRLLQSRLYPSTSIDFLYETFFINVRNVLSECLGLEEKNIWKSVGTIGNVFDDIGSTHYPDWKYFPELSSFHIIEDKKGNGKIVIGHEPICITCGKTHSSSDLSCCGYEKKVRCENCESLVPEDDLLFHNNTNYCFECSIVCACCQGDMPNSEVRYYKVSKMYGENISIENILICDDCIEGYHIECDHCNIHIHNDDVNWISDLDTNLCHDCYKDYCLKERLKNEEIKKIG